MAILERRFQKRFPVIFTPERLDAIDRFLTPSAHPALAPFSAIQMSALILLLTAVGVGVATYLGFHHRLMSFNDAFGHVKIARLTVEGYRPGAAQLGAVWLPLQHVLMLPFVWNDWAFRTGAAGAVVSVFAFVTSGAFIFLIGYRISRDKLAGLVALIVFASNPNVLYMGAAPMTEMLLVAVMCGATYFLLRWANEPERLNFLVLAATFAFLGAMTRYEGWTFGIAGCAVVIYVSLLRRFSFDSTIAHATTFGLLALYGIPLWLLWNLIIFHDPFFFKTGSFSALAINQVLNNSVGTGHDPPSWGNIVVAITDFLRASYWNAGPIIVILGAIGGLVWLVRERLSSSHIAVILLAAPIAVQAFAMYSGQLFILLPDRDGLLHNIRYGVLLIPLLAVFAGYLTRFNIVLKLAVVVLVVGQTYWMVQRGDVATYVDATASVGGGSVIPLKQGGGVNTYAQGKPMRDWLQEHYDSGLILVDSFPNNQIIFANIPSKAFLHEGVFKKWDAALENPGQHADWIYAQRSGTLQDRVWNDIQDKPYLLKDFVEVRERDGVVIYVNKNHYDEWLSNMQERNVEPETALKN